MRVEPVDALQEPVLVISDVAFPRAGDDDVRPHPGNESRPLLEVVANRAADRVGVGIDERGQHVEHVGLDRVPARTRLRGDILGLWDEARIAARAMLVVSHNIEEALAMADRIVVMSADGGRIRADIRIDLPRPRDPHSATVRHLASQVYGQMAQPC